jgi:hypothetical protein
VKIYPRVAIAKGAFNKKKIFSPTNCTSVEEEKTGIFLHLGNSFV